MLKRYIGDKAFYRRVLVVALPIVIQNFVTNFVSMLDNVMVGAMGTMPMSGVSITNQLMFVYSVCIFGACSAAGIFTAQFHGSRNHEGIRNAFRFKVMVCLLISAVVFGICMIWGRELISLYLTGEGDPAEAEQVLEYGMEYMKALFLGFIPFALANCYSTTLRECGQTVVPMVAGISAVLTNLVLNYILIFGHFGAPAMGVRGAAVATNVSRFVELGIVAGWAHAHGKIHPFIHGVYRSFRIPGKLLREISGKGLLLLFNEIAWALGIALMNQCYSTCGLEVVPAMNIANTIRNLSNVIYMAMGSAVGILMGQLMGSGASEKVVRDENRKLQFTATVAGLFCGIVMALMANVFPLAYNTEASVRHLAGQLILVCALVMPFGAYSLSAYFTLRSGGKVFITFLFDCGFVWVAMVPLAFLLSRFTDIPIVPLYLICNGTEVIKCLFGAVFLKKIKWVTNLSK